MDEIDRQVVDDIAQYGWHVIQVAEDDEGSSYDCTFRRVPTEQYPRVSGNRDEVLQGRWPWDPEASEQFRAVQPLIARP